MRVSLSAAAFVLVLVRAQAATPNLIEFQQMDSELFVARTAPGVSLSIRPQGIDLASAEGRISMHFDASAPALKPLGVPSVTTWLRPGGAIARNGYPQVLEEHLYAGIDALFHVADGHVEYDLTLAPHVSMDAIRISFEGASKVTLDTQGDLLVKGSGGLLRQKRPVVWQKGVRIPVQFALLRDGRVGFRASGKYDRSLPLTIDPVFVYERVFGGYNMDSPTAIATDLQGNVIIAGMTNSINFPTTPGAYQPQGQGPFRVSRDAGQSYTNVQFGIADSVSAVAFSNDGVIGYIDTQVGGFAIENGIYRTVDGGHSWTAVGGKLPYPSSQIVIDPTTPSTVYVVGIGVYKSVDSGETWTKLNVTSLQADSSGRSLTICATDPALLYLTSTSGQLFRSRDAGVTWTKPVLPAYAGATYVAVDPNNEKIIYYSGGFENLFKSTDGGDTWFDPNPPPLGDIYIGALLRMDANSTLYLVTAKGVHISTDGARSFTVIPNPGIVNIVSFEIDPFNASHWVLAGEKVYQSYNAGATWTETPPALGSSVVVRGDSFFVASAMNTEGFVSKWNPDGGRVLWSTYLGLTGGVSAIIADSQANIYVGGGSSVSILSPDGSRLLASAQTAGTVADMRLDGANNVYVAGQACSAAVPGKILGQPSNAPVGDYSCQGGTRSSYLEKLNSAKSLAVEYAVYLAGTDSAISLAIDATGNTFVAGKPATTQNGTITDGFIPTANALPSSGGGAYLATVSAAGDQLLYESYLGDSNTVITQMLFTSGGDLLLTGSTGGLPLPSSGNPYQSQLAPGVCKYQGAQADGFLLRLTPALPASGLRVSQLTFLGGNCFDYALSLRQDFKGNIWVSGETDSTDFPQPNAYAPAQSVPGVFALKGFVAEFSPDLSHLLFSQLFDLPARIALNTISVYVANNTGRFGSIPK